MAPGSTPSTPSGEAGLRTSSSEERTRTWDAAAATGARDTIPGPSTGDVLKNRFVVHERLTDGTASRLFRARDRRREVAGDTDSWVALKVVTAPPGREPRELQALRREAAISARLEHPNLPHILGLDHDGPHTFLCMAWLEGDSLAVILDSRGPRPMTRVQAMHIVEGVGRALVHAHALGITHADVKPGNILVTTEGNATLLDFGVALGPDGGDLPTVHGYTPEYASPEVLGGAAPTPADDLFSLACVAYRMLSGHRAFGTDNALEAAAAATRPDCPPNLSPAQWRALDRALAFTRAERQPDVATFLAQLKGLRDESPATTAMMTGEPSPTVLPTAFSRPPRRRAWRAVAVVANAAVVVGAVVLLLREPLAPPNDQTPARVGTAQRPPVTRALPARTAEPGKAMPAPPVPARGPALPAATRPGVLSDELPGNRRSAEVPRVRPVDLAGPPRPEPLVTAPVAATGGALPDTAMAAVGKIVPFSSLTVRRYVEPSYPRTAALRRLPGWVDVVFTVDDTGRTQDVRVTGAVPTGVFEEAALAAVRRWRFAAPTAEDAGPVSSQIRVRFEPQ